VSLKDPWAIRVWLRSTPSSLAPSRSIARRLWWFRKWVRNSTAMQSRLSKAWRSSRNLHSVLIGPRWAERRYQVEPISTRWATASMFMKVVMPIGRPLARSTTANGAMLPASRRATRRSISAFMPSGEGAVVYQSRQSSPSFAALGQRRAVFLRQRLQARVGAVEGDQGGPGHGFFSQPPFSRLIEGLASRTAAPKVSC